jgi:hypothetical protein
MKKTKAIVIMVLLTLTVNVFAQSNAKVIAVITKADWCGVCKKNGPRVMADVIPGYKGEAVQIIINDLTDDKTSKAGKAELETAGVYKEVSMDKATGIITLVDANTKMIISKISVAKSNEEIIKAFDEAIVKAGKS